MLDRVPTATSYSLSDERFTVHVHTSLPLEAFTPVLTTRDEEVVGELSRLDAGGYELAFPSSAPAGGTTGWRCRWATTPSGCARPATTAWTTSRWRRPPGCSTRCRWSSRCPASAASSR